MTNNPIPRFIPLLFLIIAAIHLLSFQPIPEAKGKEHFIPYENTNQDTVNTFNDEFSIPELQITPSPNGVKSYTFKKSEKVTDYDVSPDGPDVAVLIENSDGKYAIKFWQIDQSSLSDSCKLPNGFIAKAIAWHPNAQSLFVIGKNDSDYHIYRIDRINNQWTVNRIFSTPHPLRRLLVCPRPFITNNETYSYRLFFGMDNGDKTFRIVSITDQGKRFYQVVGPSATFTKNYEEELDPSKMEATWALPIAFHPGGHELIWQDKMNGFHVARYDSKYWGDSKPLNIDFENKGTITPTPNGIGFIHWQKDKNGIGIYLLSTRKEKNQLPQYQFISTPSSVADGKGIVGLTFSNGNFTLNYAPIQIPLADVMNAWMFADSLQEIEYFEKHAGLFRPNHDDQLYKLYETENYYCNSYNRSSPTRPYLVTTDIFWELFGAAYQGLFIVKERDEAIPYFWKFVNEADQYLKNSNQKSSWSTVFTALVDFNSDHFKNQEALRIKNEKDCFTEIINKTYPYSDLKPRGHYSSSPEMSRYFKAFRYFTTIFQKNQDTLKELNTLPSEITTLAEKWISCYSGFISPSRSPLVWNNLRQKAPGYCQYPQKEATVFPLSWGIDNEVLYSVVYHPNVSPDLQVKGSSGERLLPSGIDLATALGNSLAENLLEADYQKYPPLRKVIGNLKKNIKSNLNNPELKENLYNQWMDAIAVQWADSARSMNGQKDNAIWQAKRLQTGLATWATLRHATILVNERTAAECGEGGFEEILMRAPRGYVEPDPQTFETIADLFDTAVKYVSKTIADKKDMGESYDAEQRSLYEGITVRLKEAAQEARAFQLMAEKELKGESLSNEENEKILYVARTGEHLFLVFNSLSNKDYALSNPDPMAKIADVAGDGKISPYLMSAVGNAMEWNHIVPFYGRHQIVKGSIYSYYEFQSNQLLNDQEWQQKVTKQEFLPWIKPYITNQSASGMANTCY
ncbi:MAG TPA: DUF3160 domain-containing protein [Prolixibacteraceae bacterium]|nr:DUF3160 domain-containing protein [Prolixibacteraceae bacterium]